MLRDSSERDRAPFKPSVLWLVFLAAALAGSYFLFLGRFPLLEPDESRYAEIAREMIERDDYVTPTLNYVKYFEKPPLHYWLTASAFHVLGQNEFAARFWPALLSLITVAGVYLVGKRLFGRRGGMNAALVLAGTPMWLVAGRTNVIDPVVSSLIALSLLSFLAFEACERHNRRRIWLAGYYGFAGLATLAKGFIGVLFPFGIVFAYILLTRRFRLLKEIKPWAGIPLFLAITAPWFVVVIARNPDFARFFFVHEHWLRYTSGIHDRSETIFYFIPVIVVGVLPFVWSLVPAFRRALRSARQGGLRHGGVETFSILWILLIFAFYSLSNSKLPFYIQPVYPAMALLIGRHLTAEEERWDGAGLLPGVHRHGLATCLVLGWAGAIALLVAAERIGVSIRPYAIAFGAGTSLLFCLALGFGRRSRGRLTMLLFLSSSVLTLTLALGFQDSAAHLRSGHPLITDKINRLVSPTDTVVSVFTYQRHLSFYCRRRQALVEYNGELRFGFDHAEDSGAWSWDLDRFLDEWRSGRQLWVIIKEKRLKKIVESTGRELRKELHGFEEVVRAGMWILITNQPWCDAAIAWEKPEIRK